MDKRQTRDVFMTASLVVGSKYEIVLKTLSIRKTLTLVQAFIGLQYMFCHWKIVPMSSYISQVV